jgi:hypothetical protein
MRIRTLIFLIVSFVMVVFLTTGCSSGNFNNPVDIDREPVIEPCYSGVIIPPNIAPMNFMIREKASAYRITARSSHGESYSVNSSDGVVKFPVKKWKIVAEHSAGGRIDIEILALDSSKTVRFSPVSMYVARENVDPFICYRLLYPGYRSWVEMKIVQRSLGDFREKPVFENQLLDNSCVNCHSFRQSSPDKFLLHVRGNGGGTFFYDGSRLIRTNLRTKEMNANAVYPAWHPSGKYVAFSTNKTVQSFHMRPEKNIEVYDLYSSLVIYDVDSNRIYECPRRDTAEKWMETFPCWSSDGKYLYYCRARQVSRGDDYTQVRYDLARRSFDQGTLGDAEVVFDAGSIGKSVSFPVVSPDGKYLVFTLHDYGTFSIWHKEADLYILDLSDGKTSKMSLNSDNTESYHSWSSNGKWLVFSSKRDDGLTARPYFSYFFSPDSTGKPFILPQEDPGFYKRFEKTFNRPEFVTGEIKPGPRDFEKASREAALIPDWIE